MQVIAAGLRVLLMTATAGCMMPAAALADCPELEQLQIAYLDAARRLPERDRKPSPAPLPLPTKEHCESYRRLSEATKAWIDYARQTGELCRFSGLLPTMEREYNAAVEARDNVCSGRPARPGLSLFPAERGIRR